MPIIQLEIGTQVIFRRKDVPAREFGPGPIPEEGARGVITGLVCQGYYDVSFPGLDPGGEGFQALSEHNLEVIPHSPVVALKASASSPDYREGFEAGYAKALADLKDYLGSPHSPGGRWAKEWLK